MTTVFDAIREFDRANAANNLKPNTRKWYMALLKDFDRRFATRALDTMTAPVLREYVIAIRKDAKSAVTAIDKITALHSFWAFAAEEYGCANPMARIKKPRRPKPTLKAPPTDHVRALVAAIKPTFWGLRDLALLMLVIDACLRIDEALSLRLEDVDFYHHQITVLAGKGDKARVVPFTRDVEKVMVIWLKKRGGTSEFIFTSFGGDRLKYAGAREILRRLHVKAGLEKFYSWHKYRHYGARHYRLLGGDIFDLQKILGHSAITTTVDHYGNFISDELVDKHEKLSAVNTLREDKGI